MSSQTEKKGMIKWGFVLITLVIYGVLYIKYPSKTSVSMKTSLRVLSQISIPILIAFMFKFLINLYVSPVKMQKLLAKGAGVRGIIFSSLAGVLSMGPIFAWYPLLKDFREKGVPDLYLANFLTSRAVKPFLLPVMVYYFGWMFSIILNVLILIFSPVVGVLTGLISDVDS